MTAKKKRKPFKFEKKVLNRPDWDQEFEYDAPWWVEDPPTRQRKGRPLQANEPEPRQLVKARTRFEKEYGSAHATIKPGQWQQNYHRPFAVWVHRLSRAVANEVSQMPEKPPPLPWPIRKKPTQEIRAYNSSLFPRVPVKPRREYLVSYVPKSVDLATARTEVYAPGPGDDWLWRIRLCWDEPRPWEVEAIVDPGGALYLPFFRQVTIRLPLKAKICRDLKARKDGQWVGPCQSVGKLNAREAVSLVAKSLMENGQSPTENKKQGGIDNGELIIDSGSGAASFCRSTTPGTCGPLPLLDQGGELGGAARPGKKPPKGGTPNAGFLPQDPAPDPRDRALRAGTPNAGFPPQHPAPDTRDRALRAGTPNAGFFPQDPAPDTRDRALRAGTPNAGFPPQHPAPDTRDRALRAPAAHCSLLTAHSPGLVAYQAKVAARKVEEERANLAHHRSLVTAHSKRWPVEFESASGRRARWESFEREQASELEAIGAVLQMPAPVNYDLGPPTFMNRVPDFLRRDDLDGYLVTRQEVGADPFDYDWPKKRVRPLRRTRKRKRPSTSRDRLAKVKPSLRIYPTGPRSAELVITRRMHEVKTGLPQALELARMVEGAIKYRNPPQPNRKQSWRQRLRSAVLYRPGLLTFLVRNPMDCEAGADGRESGELGKPVFYRTTTPGTCGPLPLLGQGGELLGAARPGKKPPKGGTPNAGFRPQHPTPDTRHRALRAALPREYAGLIDRQWLTPESGLLDVTPAGGFATTVEGFRLRLPLAVMPPAVYERWLARRGMKRARRKLRKGSSEVCRCSSGPNVRVGRSSASARSPAFRRNRTMHVPLN